MGREEAGNQMFLHNRSKHVSVVKSYLPMLPNEQSCDASDETASNSSVIGAGDLLLDSCSASS